MSTCCYGRSRSKTSAGGGRPFGRYLGRSPTPRTQVVDTPFIAESAAEKATSGSGREITIRYAGRCSCGVQLPVGSKASWDADVRTVTCLACLDHVDAVTSAVPDDSAALPAGSTASINVGRSNATRGLTRCPSGYASLLARSSMTRSTFALGNPASAVRSPSRCWTVWPSSFRAQLEIPVAHRHLDCPGSAAIVAVAEREDRAMT